MSLTIKYSSRLLAAAIYKCPLPSDVSPLAAHRASPPKAVHGKGSSTMHTCDNPRTWPKEIRQRTGEGIDFDSTVTD